MDNLKRLAWTVCRFKGELGKKEGWDVLRGGDTPMHTMRKMEKQDATNLPKLEGNPKWKMWEEFLDKIYM